MSLACALDDERDTAAELADLRQLVRVIGHELGNSLGPIASLLGSARLILAREAAGSPRVDLVFDTVEERVRHLRAFLDDCVRLARLPDPHPAPADWTAIARRLCAMWPALIIEVSPGSPDTASTFDVGQIEQVLINLVKNAYEASGPADDVRVRVAALSTGGTEVTVLDRGRGVTDFELAALSAGAFTRKGTGGGVGLGVCRTLVARHGGSLRIARRPGGGMSVSFWLPAR